MDEETVASPGSVVAEGIAEDRKTDDLHIHRFARTA